MVKAISLTYIFQVMYVLVFYLANISGERLHDHWSSGLNLSQTNQKMLSTASHLLVFPKLVYQNQ